MPDRRQVDVAFPLKGLLTTVGRGAQSLEFSTGLQNVMPLDVNGRLRGSQRPGTSKLFAAALTGATNVAAMVQAGLTLSASALGEEVYHDLLQYTNGHVNASTASSYWDSRGDTGSTTVYKTGLAGSSDNTLGIRAGSQMYMESTATADKPVIAFEKAARSFSLPGAFTWSINAYLSYANPMAGIPDIHAGTCRLLVGIDPASPTTVAQVISVCVCRHWCAIIEGEPTLTNWATFIGGGSAWTYAALSTPLESGSHKIRLGISGTSAKLYIDGNLMISRTLSTTRTSSQKHPAIGIGSNCGTTDYVDNIYLYSGVDSSASRSQKIVAAHNNTIYVGTAADASLTAATSTATSINSAATYSEMAASRGYAFYADGEQKPKKVNLNAVTVADHVASAGTGVPEYCQICCFWRDRLIYASSATEPHNFFASRQGYHDDFNYGANDEGAAFAGNVASQSSTSTVTTGVGEPITALIPASDDILFIGCDHSLWRMTGDPTAGGVIDLVTSTIGLLGSRSWCQGPDGAIYFVGSGGFYRMTPTEFPTSLSRGVVDNIFSGLNRSTHRIQLAWDRDNQGCYIFITVIASGASTHYWFDSRTGGFFPLAFPNTMGPMSTIVYDGDGPTDRFVLLGGRDGFFYKVATSNLSDAGTAISSYVNIGPIHPDAGDDSDGAEGSCWIHEGSELVFGDGVSDFRCRMTIQSGSHEYEAFNSPTRSAYIDFTSGGRKTRVVRRVTGGVFYVKLSNSTLDKSWNFEKMNLSFVFGGLRRLK